MSYSASDAAPAPTLAGWVTRDTLITAFLLLGVLMGDLWYTEGGGWLIGGIASIFAFIACYLLCYILHEWGHYLGARLSGVDMPLAPYRGPVLGVFRIDEYDRRQYLWLSWGGDLAHVLVTLLAVMTYVLSGGGLVLAAFAVGGLAFSAQALAVDQPIIWRVTFGADIQTTARAGTNPQIILKRTWQTWIPLFLVVAFYAVS